MLISDIEVFFSFYGVIFLLYLIVRFSNPRKCTKLVNDRTSGRKVPALLFIKNQSIVQHLEDELESNEVKRKATRLETEMNEYFHALI